MRQVVLDTETTGLYPNKGHKITEIGCVELIDRVITGNEFQSYINPQRDIEQKAIEITGITNEKVANAPLFADVIDDFIEFVGDADLIIHNAPFDIGFLTAEFKHLDLSFDDILGDCTVIDTLSMARKKYPGQRNSLDALCQRFDIKQFARDKHGALLDSQILAHVFFALTGGQRKLFDQDNAQTIDDANNKQVKTSLVSHVVPVVKPSKQELSEHNAMLDFLAKSNKIKSLWEKIEN